MKRFIKAAIGVGLIAIVVLGGVYAANAFKLSYYQIETGSMEPNLPVGTRVVVSGSAGYKPNDAISFVADGHVVTHVFLGYNKDGSLITRGVANPSNDEWNTPVYPRDVKGRVLFQILLFAPSFWLSRSGIAVIGGLLLICLALLGGSKSESDSQGTKDGRNDTKGSSPGSDSVMVPHMLDFDTD